MRSLKQSSPSRSDHSDAWTDFPLDRRSSSAAFTTASSCLPARFPLWISRRISCSSPSGDNPERARTACTAKNSGRSRVTFVINQHLFTLTGTRLVTCPFTFYHMITHMILSSLSHYLCLSLLSLIYIPMESSRISITPYDDTLLIVLTCSTLIPTYAKSS